jgi:hypothetical protein
MATMRKEPFAPLIFCSVGLYFALMTALAAFVLHPPLLGWIGLAVAASVGMLAAAVALAFFARMRTNSVRAQPHAGPVYRLLVVSDADVDPAELSSAVGLRLAGRRARVFVIAPVMSSELHFLATDEEREQAGAAARLARTLRTLAEAGIVARGSVGTDDPLQAVGDVLAEFPADEVLLLSSLPARRSWLDRDFEVRARETFGVPVSTVSGPTTATL